MWVLDSVQGRFHNMSPGGFEGGFIKALGSDTKEGLRIEEATGENLCGAVLWLSRNVICK